LANKGRPPTPEELEEAKRAFDEEAEEHPADPKSNGQGGPQQSAPSAASATPGKANFSTKPSLHVVPPSEPWQRPGWLPTGEAMVRAAKARFGAEYLEAGGQPYHWTGSAWELDECHLAENHFSEFCCEVGAFKVKKPVRNKIETGGFVRSHTARLLAMLSVPINRLDQAPVINTLPATYEQNASGVWVPRPHQREDYCTKITAVAPIAGSLAMWLGFLDTIMEGDREMIDYLQRVAGYILSPWTREQVFWFFYGSGGNGKGTFLRTLAHIFGTGPTGYAATASLDLFLATPFEKHPEELAALRAVRLLMCTETEKGRSWNETKIKALTGGDPIRCHFMRQNSFEYVPQFKPVIAGNNKPTIKSVDEAMARRLQLVPFNKRVQADPTFEARMLASEAPAILAWVFEGVAEYCRHGLSPPDKVIAASTEYLEEQDENAQWRDERCELAPDHWLFSSEGFRDWSEWCKGRGLRAGQIKQFVETLKKAGFELDHKRNGNGFYGLALKKIESGYRDE